MRKATCIIACLLIANSSLFCSAQQPSFGRPGTPTTSPYLNLIPGSNFSPALNYYRSYRPEREFRRDAQQFSRSLGNLQNEVDRLSVAEQKATSMLGATGHRTSFHNLGNYFPQRQRTSR
jgi:hypothetical protein